MEGLDSGKRQSSAEKARLILGLRPQHDLATLLQVAQLPRSTFYYHCAMAQAGDKYAQLKEQIATIFAQHKQRYGYRRVHAQLRNLGEQVNHKLVQRLMQELGLKSPVRRKKYNSWRGNLHVAAPNVLARRFKAKDPNRKWVTDVTEFNVNGEKLYLSPVLDLYNGEIIAYEMQTRPQYTLVKNMLRKAFKRLGKHDKPVLHSDQGWQYRMRAYRRALKKRRVVQSMSRKGNCLDNAAMESFFGTLKSEYFHLNKFTSVEQLRKGIHEYIHYYNHDRIKCKLNGLSPVQYRTQPRVA